MHYFLKFIFGIKLYMFRTVPLSNIRSYFTVHTAMLYVTQVCWQLASSILLRRAGNFLTVATGRNWKFCLLSLSLSLSHTHTHTQSYSSRQKPREDITEVSLLSWEGLDITFLFNDTQKRDCFWWNEQCPICRPRVPYVSRYYHIG